MGSMAAAPTEFLARVGLFSDLSKRELKAIAASMQEHRFAARRELVTEGKLGVAFFVIADGSAAVIRAGAEVAALGPGDYFGEIALITDRARTATVTAQTDLICWTLSSWAFRSIVKANPSIAWKLLVQMGRLVAGT
jgi:CRP-like cAMP-binding protein